MFTIDYDIRYMFDFQKDEYDIEVVGFDTDTIHIINHITSETNGRVISTEYVSKYNHAVKYDYEPFCIEGFNINHTIRFSDRDNEFYFEYLLDKILDEIKHLENCLDVEETITNE